MMVARGQDAILIRQLKADIETKKREIIEACELTSRVSKELEDARERNINKQERENYKFSCEKKKLLSVIEMQK